MKSLERAKASKPIDEKENKLGLTKEEQLCHDKLIECMDIFMKLEFQHPEDNREFCYAIHLIQGLLTMRVARRQYPNGWVTYEMKEINEKEKCIINEKNTI